MPHVVVPELCTDCKHTSCVAVCPVDCFHEDDRTLYINPDECIDCGACIPECPEEAIFEVDDLPDEFQSCISLNAEKSSALPVIAETHDPLMRRGDCRQG
jgi:ferredoxin